MVVKDFTPGPASRPPLPTARLLCWPPRFEDSKPLKVLWLAHAIPYPPHAGFLLRSYNLLRELTRFQTVDLIAFIQEPWVRTLFPSLEQGLEESRRAVQEFCRTVTFLPIDAHKRPFGKQRTAVAALLGGGSYSTSWLVSERGHTAIRQQVAAESYDLVHFDTVGLAPYRPLAAGTPATLMHQNIESHMMLRRAATATNALARAYFRHEGMKLRGVEQKTAAAFATHITCSELDSIRLREIVPNAHAVVVPNGVDCEFFASAGTPTRANSLAFVGTMNWYPNVDAMQFFLRDVWPGLRQQVPGLTLDIAGSNPPDSLVQLGQSLAGVSVRGYLPDIRPLIDGAAIFVCPIRDGGGTKLKILDAFAMRKCVVAHPIACEGIDVTPGRDVILASTPQEFVAAIRALLEDAPRRVALGTAARELVEKQYSFRAIGAQFSSVLEETARRQPSPR
jgi:glycosyltransferase involved in cell wall biosynthesis